MFKRLDRNQNLLNAREMAGHAVVVGLDQEKFKQCFEGGKFMTKVKADESEGTTLRVTGTPTFFFGYPDEKDATRVRAVKLLSGAQQLNAFTEILDSLLNPPKESSHAPAQSAR